MEKKLKVLHYIPGFNMGGIESRLVDWYSNIDRNKIEFIIIKLNQIDDSNKLQEFINLGGRFYNLKPLRPRTFFNYYKNLKRIIKEEKPDVIHVHSLSSGLFPLFIGKRLKIRTRILHSRTTDYLPKEKNRLIKSFIRKITSRYATHFFGCSLEAGIWGCGQKHKKDIVVIRNGINIEKFVFNEAKRSVIRKELMIDDKYVIGSIGRLSPQKNIPFLIRTFKEFLNYRKDSVLLLVGDGSEKTALLHLVEQLGIENSVFFVGGKDNVWDYYMAFDIFVCSSFYEGFGTTAIESQATGLLTVVSSGFPNTVVITDRAFRLDLSEGEANWASFIFEKSKLRIVRSSKTAEMVSKAGYSAREVGFNLQKIYEGKL